MSNYMTELGSRANSHELDTIVGSNHTSCVGISQAVYVESLPTSKAHPSHKCMQAVEGVSSLPFDSFAERHMNISPDCHSSNIRFTPYIQTPSHVWPSTSNGFPGGSDMAGIHKQPVMRQESAQSGVFLGSKEELVQGPQVDVSLPVQESGNTIQGGEHESHEFGLRGFSGRKLNWEKTARFLEQTMGAPGSGEDYVDDAVTGNEPNNKLARNAMENQYEFKTDAFHPLINAQTKVDSVSFPENETCAPPGFDGVAPCASGDRRRCRRDHSEGAGQSSKWQPINTGCSHRVRDTMTHQAHLSLTIFSLMCVLGVFGSVVMLASVGATLMIVVPRIQHLENSLDKMTIAIASHCVEQQFPESMDSNGWATFLTSAGGAGPDASEGINGRNHYDGDVWNTADNDDDGNSGGSDGDDQNDDETGNDRVVSSSSGDDISNNGEDAAVNVTDLGDNRFEPGVTKEVIFGSVVDFLITGRRKSSDVGGNTGMDDQNLEVSRGGRGLSRVARSAPDNRKCLSTGRLDKICKDRKKKRLQRLQRKRKGTKKSKKIQVDEFEGRFYGHNSLFKVEEFIDNCLNNVKGMKGHVKACRDSVLEFRDKGTTMGIFKPTNITAKTKAKKRLVSTGNNTGRFKLLSSGIFIVHINVTIVDKHHSHSLALFLNGEAMLSCDHGGFRCPKTNTDKSFTYRICNIQGTLSLNEGDILEVQTLQAHTKIRLQDHRTAYFRIIKLP